MMVGIRTKTMIESGPALSSRREMQFLDTLNPEQREAVLHINGPLLILAGAGSGKTRVITSRVAYLVGGGHAQAQEVLAVTFTNKAAEEMRTRVEALLGADCGRMWVSTFHSLCARLLRREAPAIGLPRDFVIYDSSDQVAVVKQALKDLQIDDSFVQPRIALARISHAKNRMDNPETIAAASWHPRDQQFAKVYAYYQKALTGINALDFDDLLLKTVELFERSERVHARYAQQFRFVMVDEYQDTNRPQYLLIRRLAGIHRNLCVVGDPDQSIYKWRGADLRNILDFEGDFPEARIVKLERNYRSTTIILDAASAVIRQNRNRKDKHLWTDRQGGDRIAYYRGTDELEEADFITRTARTALADDVEATVAVLYRTNAQSRAIEDALMREGVMYKVVGGVRFYERREIKDALAYMRLVINPHDDVSLRRVINTPARGIGKGVMEAVERVAAEPAAGLPLVAEGPPPALSVHSLWARILRGLEARVFPARAAASLAAFRDLIVSLTEMARRESPSIAIGKMLDQSGYLQDLRDEHSEDAEGRVENLAELVSAAREYESREPEPSLGGFVDRLSLLSDVDEEQGSRDARVWLMTLHSAKGLEFPVVVIAGLEEGLFPHSRASGEEDDIEEERRLCYVGMTRARSRLVLTGAARRRIFGEYQSTEPSRFIDEVPAELVDRMAPSFSSSSSAPYQGHFPHYEFRTDPYGRRGRRVRERTAEYAYEDEDQSTGMFALHAGMRVRHPQFGVGSVISVEPLDRDTKLVVRFNAVGVKTLRAKYARLEPA
jgi:DNA helicase II / ATP-dependent DNA helicase PcrA